MKKILKIISLILVIMILNSIILLNVVQAVDGKQINIYTKGNFKKIIIYNGIAVKTAHAVYIENGQEYPAYCLNKDLHGVGDYIATYDVTNQGKITDLGLWRVIINGYPYKTIKQLGLMDECEAYTATKQAIYCYIYNRGTENYSAVGEAGERVINAINTILQNAKNSTETYENQNIEIIPQKNWQIEKNYITKQYEVKSNINITNYKVSVEELPKESKITNLENQEKIEFNSNEKFKISIPINSLAESGQFKIKIKTQMETKPIFFGKAPNTELQDYALTAFSYEDAEAEILQNYEKNETKIIIQKQDKETKENLQGAIFEILNMDMQTIKKAETDEKGKIILEQLVPGTYFIKEVKAPKGYELNEEIKKFEIEINELKTIKIENTKITIEEEPPKEIPKEEDKPPEIEPIIEKPKLPITGM